MKLEPFEDRVVVLRDEPEKLSTGGIALSDRAQPVKLTGKVLFVGPGRWSEDGKVFLATTIVTGERVLFPAQGYDILWDYDKTGQTLVLRQSQLLAKIWTKVTDPKPVY